MKKKFILTTLIASGLALVYLYKKKEQAKLEANILDYYDDDFAHDSSLTKIDIKFIKDYNKIQQEMLVQKNIDLEKTYVVNFYLQFFNENDKRAMMEKMSSQGYQVRDGEFIYDVVVSCEIIIKLEDLFEKCTTIMKECYQLHGKYHGWDIEGEQ